MFVAFAFATKGEECTVEQRIFQRIYPTVVTYFLRGIIDGFTVIEAFIHGWVGVKEGSAKRGIDLS